MNKKIIWFLGIGVFTGICFFFLLSGKSPDHALQFIPKNAFVVASIDPKSLAEKADFDKIKKLAFWENFEKEIQQAKKGQPEQIISEIIDDPGQTGIDFQNRIYMFSISPGNSSFFLSATIRNEKAFEKFIVKMSGNKTKNMGGFKEIRDHGFIYAWTKNGLLISASSLVNMQTEIDKMITLKHRDCFSSNSFYRSFAANNTVDFWAIGSLQQLSRNLNPFRFVSDDSKSPFNLENAYLAYSLNFESDKIKLGTSFNIEDAEYQKIFGSISGKGLDNTLLSCMTNKDTYAALGFSVDIKSILGFYKNYPATESFLDELSDQTGLSTDELENLLTGNICASLVGFNMEPYTHTVYNYDYENGDYDDDDYWKEVTEDRLTPIFTITIGILDKKALKTILDKTGLEMNNKGFYHLNTYNMNLYLVQNDAGITITNESTLAAELANYGHFDQKPPALVTKLLQHNTFSMYADLDFGKYPALVHEYMEKEMGSFNYNKLKTFMDLFKNITVYGNGASGSFDLNMNPGNGNSLYRLIEGIDRMTVEKKHDRDEE